MLRSKQSRMITEKLFLSLQVDLIVWSLCEEIPLVSYCLSPRVAVFARWEVGGIFVVFAPFDLSGVATGLIQSIPWKLIVLLQHIAQPRSVLGRRWMCQWNAKFQDNLESWNAVIHLSTA